MEELTPQPVRYNPEVLDLTQLLELSEQGQGYTEAWQLEHPDEEYPQ